MQEDSDVNQPLFLPFTLKIGEAYYHLAIYLHYIVTMDTAGHDSAFHKVSNDIILFKTTSFISIDTAIWHTTSISQMFSIFKVEECNPYIREIHLLISYKREKLYMYG